MNLMATTSLWTWITASPNTGLGRCLSMFIGCLCLFVAARAQQQQFNNLNDTVSGKVLLAPAADLIKDAMGYQLLVDNIPVSGVLRPASEGALWDTATVWDGQHQVSARIFTSATDSRLISRFVRVANSGWTVRVISPAPNSTVSGNLNWQVLAEAPPEKASVGVEALMFFVDGRQAALLYGRADRAVSVDTTRLANGPHELFVAAYSKDTGIPAVAMSRIQITVDNGVTARALAPKYAEIVLTPGETTELPASLLNTDGSRAEVADLSYRSTNTAVATVSSTGSIEAVKPGTGTIELTSGKLQATVRVQVVQRRQFPHFASNGELLNEYTPGRSIWIRSLFGLDPEELRGSPWLAPYISDAAINTLTTSLYINPVHSSTSTTLEAWRKGWQDRWNAQLATVEKANLLMLFAGDDVARTAPELDNSINNPWAPDAIKHALSTVQASGRAVAIDMVDEVNFLWGETPFPTDGRWAKNKPAIPDNAFSTLLKSINAVQGRTPISWPASGNANDRAVRNWFDSSVSDYYSHYWTFTDWRRAYPESASTFQIVANMDRTVAGRQQYLDPAKPSLVLTSGTGPFYTKNVAGDNYQPGVDTLQAPGHTPEAVAAQIAYAALRGTAGVRLYHFDAQRWKDDRSKARLGLGDRQTGLDPRSVGTDRWIAMSNAFRLIAQLEPYILQPASSAPYLGPELITGARSGAAGTLVMAINTAQADATAQLDSFGESMTGIAYRLDGLDLRSEVFNPAAPQTWTLKPSESIFVLVRPAGETVAAPQVDFADFLPQSVLDGTAAVCITPKVNDAVSKVELHIDGQLAAESSEAPFKLNFNPEGRLNIWRSITLKAFSTDGASAERRSAWMLAGAASPTAARRKPQPSQTVSGPRKTDACAAAIAAAPRSGSNGIPVQQAGIVRGAINLEQIFTRRTNR